MPVFAPDRFIAEVNPVEGSLEPNQTLWISEAGGSEPGRRWIESLTQITTVPVCATARSRMTFGRMEPVNPRRVPTNSSSSCTWAADSRGHRVIMKPFETQAVAQAFDAYPEAMRQRLLALRELIFETAAATEGVGKLEEALKWGEPAYLTSESRSGSTIRIGWKKKAPSQYAMYFNCQTSLIETFKTLFPGEFRFEGNRAIIFSESEVVSADSLAFCIAAALTYHRNKSAASSGVPAR